MIIPQEQQLLLSGSKAMNVNGSVTPKVFSYAPANGVFVQINSLSVAMADNAASSWTKFGAITGLANGVLIEAVIGGNAYQLGLLQDNQDLNRFFSHNHHGSSLVSTLGVILGLGGAEFTFVGHQQLPCHIILNGTNSDLLRVTVQDDLSGLVALSMSALISKEV